MDKQNNNPTYDTVYSTFDDYLKALTQRLVARVWDEVPEAGVFTDVFEFFTNPDEASRNAVERYGLRVFKMPEDIVPDATKRYIEAAAYFPGSEYKVTMVVCHGNKQELLEMMGQQDFIDRLNDSYAQLLDIAETS